MTTQNPIRVGIVGCGYQGQWLTRAVGEVQALQVVAYADPDMQAIQKTAAYCPTAAPYATSEELIGLDDVDAVFVATPHHLLQPFAVMAAERGKHVLVEKPIALNGAQAADLEDAAHRAVVVAMAGYSFRFFPELQQARQLLERGAVGEIVAISGGIGSAARGGGWWADPKAGGGPLLFLGSHLIDQVLWFAGDTPTDVFADVRDRRETGTDATTAFQMHFAGGAVAHCLVTDETDTWFSYIHVLGRSGKLHLNLSAFPNYALTVQSRVPEYATMRTIASGLDRETAILGKLRAELLEFATAVQENRKHAEGAPFS